MTYQEALAYLEQASSFGIKPGLERITALMEALGNPQEDYKIVHPIRSEFKSMMEILQRKPSVN